MKLKDKGAIILDKILNWLFCLIVFLIPIWFSFWQFTYNGFTVDKAVVFRILLYLIIIAYLGKIFLNKKISWSIVWPLILFGLLIIYWIVNLVIVSLDPTLSFWGSIFRQQGLYDYLHYALFFIIGALQLKERRQLTWLITAVLFSSFFVCVYGVIQFLGLDWLSWDDNSSLRLFSSLGQPNFLGHYLIIVIPFTIYAFIFLFKKLWYRALLTGLWGLQIFVLFFTYSRAAWLAFLSIIFLLFLIWLIFQKHQKILPIILISIISIIFTSTVFLNNQIINFFNKQKVNSLAGVRLINILDFKNQSRTLYWQAVIQEFNSADWTKKLFGYGQGLQEEIFIKHYLPSWSAYEEIDNFSDRAHNLILDIWLEFGLVGLLLNLIFSGFIIYQAVIFLIRYYQQQDKKYWLVVFCLVALVGYFINNLFSFSLITHYLYYYLLLLFLLTLLNENQQRWELEINFKALPLTIIWVSIVLFLGFFAYNFSIKLYLSNHYFLQGERAIAQVNCPEALNNFNRALALYPLDRVYYYRYFFAGINCFGLVDQASRKTLAVNLLDKIQAQLSYQTDYKNLFYAARIYGLLGLDTKKAAYLNQAEDYYQQTIKFSPFVLENYRDYSRFLALSDKNEQAIQIAKLGLDKIAPLTTPGYEYRINNLKKEYTKFYIIIGNILKKQDNWPGALGYFSKAWRLDQLNIENYRNLSDCYYKLGDLDKAIEYTKRAQHLEPSNALWPLNLSLLYKAKGNKILSLQCAQTAIILDPNNQQAKDIITEWQSLIGQ